MVMTLPHPSMVVCQPEGVAAPLHSKILISFFYVSFFPVRGVSPPSEREQCACGMRHQLKATLHTSGCGAESRDHWRLRLVNYIVDAPTVLYPGLLQSADDAMFLFCLPIFCDILKKLLLWIRTHTYKLKIEGERKAYVNIHIQGGRTQAESKKELQKR